jgi:hypothetical protein
MPVLTPDMISRSYPAREAPRTSTVFHDEGQYGGEKAEFSLWQYLERHAISRQAALVQYATDPTLRIHNQAVGTVPAHAAGEVVKRFVLPAWVCQLEG